MTRDEIIEKKADLSGADLSWADLSRADLSGADLSGADLRRAYLSGANLSGAYLSGANLSGAYLFGANLCEANLSGANLSGVSLPAPTVVLQAAWGEVSDDLCIELMRYDAANHPDPAAFDVWSANPHKCPYRDCRVGRVASFVEQAQLWSPGPALSALVLMDRLIEEKCKR